MSRPVGDHRERQPVGDREEAGVEFNDAAGGEDAARIGIGLPRERHQEFDVVEDLLRARIQRGANGVDEVLRDAADALAVELQADVRRKCGCAHEQGEYQ